MIISSFNTINTKISAMKSNTLQDGDYIEIMQANSIAGVLDYLIEHSVYQEVLWDLRGRDLHRNEIERRLYRYHILLIEKLILYLKKEYRELLKKYLARYEIEDVKLVFQIVRGKVNPAYIEDLFSYSRYLNLNFPELLAQDSIEKVLEKLKGTPYYRLISPYVKNVDEKFNFYLEMVLDQFYYLQLMESVEKLPDPEDKKSAEILRRNVDLYNLEWIYRATNFFDLSKEEILNFVLDRGYVYAYPKLKELVYDIEGENLPQQLMGTEYEFLLNHPHDIDLFMERRIDRYLYYKSKNLYQSSLLTFGKVFAFITLIEFEIKDLIALIESKRYQMPAEEISKYLIRRIEVK